MRGVLLRGCAAVALLLCLHLCLAKASAESATMTPSPAVSVTEFIGVAGKNLRLYQRPSTEANVLATIPSGTPLDVVESKRKWTQVIHEGQTGYLDTKYVELVQRRDPFGGNMPGVSAHQYLALVMEDTTFQPEDYKYAVKLKKGTLLSIAKCDETHAFFPYLRQAVYVKVPLKDLSLKPQVPWQEAAPGDLLYAFSTFYSVSTSKKYNIGRMENIALACMRLNGTIVRSGEEFSFNAVCAPYTEENGYKLAPILSADNDAGFGGGTCQVCTTLYNIVLRVPAIVVERHWHAQSGAKYAPAGFDATVGTKSDMRFINVLPYDVRIGYVARDGVMTAMLYRAEE